MKFAVVLALFLNHRFASAGMSHGFDHDAYESESSGTEHSEPPANVTLNPIFDTDSDEFSDDEDQDMTFFPGLSGQDGFESTNNSKLPRKPRHYKPIDVDRARDLLFCLNTSLNVRNNYSS